ncbi:peptidylprolyl isomerase [bacterium BD-1]|nr:peptidylprolyl isomerase [Ottowia caeni]
MAAIAFSALELMGQCIFRVPNGDITAEYPGLISETETLMLVSRSLSSLFVAILAVLPLASQAQSVPSVQSVAAASKAAPGAGETVLMRGPGGVVTAAQLQAAVQFLVPPAQRESFFSKPQNIEQLVLSIYTRQNLVQQAKQQGFDRQADVASILAFAQQQALSDLWLLKQAEAREPTSQQLEQYARSVYNAQPADVRESVQLKVRHIMVAPSSTMDDAQAKAKADRLLGELKAGANFEALARAESSDKSSAAKGGELPIVAIGMQLTQFDVAASKLTKPGEISEVVKTEHGYHIIQLIERQVSSGFERQRAELIEQARARLTAQSRVELMKAAQDGAEPDAAAISALVREPASK